MVTSLQDSFAGGVRDAGALVGSGFVAAENVALDASGALVQRDVVALSASSLGCDILYSLPVESERLGRFFFIVWRDSGAIHLGGFKYDAVERDTQVLFCRLPELPYMPGLDYITEQLVPDQPPGPLVKSVVLQAGQSVYVFLEFTLERRVYSGSLANAFAFMDMDAVYLYFRSYAVGAVNCGAVLGERFFLAVRRDGYKAFSNVWISDRLAYDEVTPDLAASAAPLRVGSDTDIIAMCALETEVIVFKSYCVYAVTHAREEPGEMRIRFIGLASILGPGAYCRVGGHVYFAAVDGLCRIGDGGGLENLSAHWRAYWDEQTYGRDDVSMARLGSLLLVGGLAERAGGVGVALVYSLAHDCCVGVWADAGLSGRLVGHGDGMAYCLATDQFGVIGGRPVSDSGIESSVVFYPGGGTAGRHRLLKAVFDFDAVEGSVYVSFCFAQAYSSARWLVQGRATFRPGCSGGPGLKCYLRWRGCAALRSAAASHAALPDWRDYACN